MTDIMQGGAATGGVLTPEDIKTAFYLQSATINALVGILVERRLILPKDVQELTRRRNALVAAIEAQDRKQQEREKEPKREN